jgi:hypothetical protein
MSRRNQLTDFDSPSTNGDTGRNRNGQFAPGWKGGPGNPLASKLSANRAALLSAITAKQIRTALKRLMSIIVDGKDGDSLAAVKLLLDRFSGSVESMANEIMAEEVRSLRNQLEEKFPESFKQ